MNEEQTINEYSPKKESATNVYFSFSGENIFDKISYFAFCATVFLLPVFVFPFAISPLNSSKAILLYVGTLVSFFFWLFSGLRKGSVEIPKSPILVGAAMVSFFWLVSSLLSPGMTGVSLVGKMYDMDTFSVIAFSSLLLFMAITIFRSAGKTIFFYLALFVSAFIVFIFQFFHILLEINIIPLNIFPYTVSNLVGNWSDLPIFFGLTGIISLVFLELFRFKKIIKMLLYVLLAISILSMIVSGFLINWIVFGAVALLFFLWVSSYNPQARHISSAGERYHYNFLRPSLVIVIIAAFFVFSRGLPAGINNAIGINYTEIRPSWSVTWSVLKKSMKENPIFGSGPNTFSLNWMKYKPQTINNTIFWNTRFSSAAGYFPSTVVTTGLFGALALAAFILAFFTRGAKYFFYKRGNSFEVMTVASFLGAVFLWLFTIFYSPGIVILILTFAITGVFAATLSKTEKRGVIKISFTSEKRTGFLFSLAATLVLIGSVTVLYVYFQKVLALRNYGKALMIFNSNGNIDNAIKKMATAASLDGQDEYFRSLSEASLLKLNNIFSNNDKNIPKEDLQKMFQEQLSWAIRYGQEAINSNSNEPLNWIQFGRVYEAIVPLKISGAKEKAVSAYNKALDLSPFDPSLYLALARVSVQSQKNDEAKNYLNKSIEIKRDYLPALFSLVQIEIQAGNTKEAITKTEEAIALYPNDTGLFFQLGLLYYDSKDMSNARLSLERTISLNENYANARYFLGLVYDKQGLKNKAIEQFEIIQKTNPDNEEVKKILSNLKSGKNALAETKEIPPEKRKEPPINEEEDQSVLKKEIKKK